MKSEYKSVMRKFYFSSFWHSQKEKLVAHVGGVRYIMAFYSVKFQLSRWWPPIPQQSFKQDVVAAFLKPEAFTRISETTIKLQKKA